MEVAPVSTPLVHVHPEPSPEPLLHLGLGFMGSQVLLSAVDLGVFTALAEAPAEAGPLAERLGLHPRGALDFFDALVSLRLLDRIGGVYHNTPAVDLYFDRAKSTYLGGLLEMAHLRLYTHWANLTDGLRSGRPQNEAKDGGNSFDSIYADPVRLASFLAAMTGVSLPSAVRIAELFPFERFGTFADLGCAQGGCPVAIARAHAHLRGVGFDLPVVEPTFTRYVAANGLADRVVFQAGDFFADALPDVQVYVLGHILHDWDLEQKRAILRRVHEALPQDGAVIVYDTMIDDDRRENTFGLLMSLNMLIETPGGFDYTGADCRRWLAEAGFRDVYTAALDGVHSMAVGYK